MGDIKLSSRDSSILEAMRSGSTLHTFNSYRRDEDGFQVESYFLEPGGATAHGYSVRKLLQAGIIRPAQDGLFPGFSQTYELAE